MNDAVCSALARKARSLQQQPAYCVPKARQSGRKHCSQAHLLCVRLAAWAKLDCATIPYGRVSAVKHYYTKGAAQHCVAARRRCASSKIGRISCAIICFGRSRSIGGGAAERQALGHTLVKHLALDMLLRFEVRTRFSLVMIPVLFLAACSALPQSSVSPATSLPDATNVLSRSSVSPATSSATATAEPFMGVPERIATTPFPAVILPDQPESNFAFSIGYGACSITRILDTFTDTLTQHSMDGSSASIAFRLSPDERAAIYQAIKTINLFGYPNVYAIVVPENTMQIMTEPHPRYELVLRNGTLNKMITWEDSISRPTTVEADQLRSFIERIRALVANHPEIAQLPPLNEGCA